MKDKEVDRILSAVDTLRVTVEDLCYSANSLEDAHFASDENGGKAAIKQLKKTLAKVEKAASKVAATISNH